MITLRYEYDLYRHEPAKHLRPAVGSRSGKATQQYICIPLSRLHLSSFPFISAHYLLYTP
jgi:hypothetical protein